VGALVIIPNPIVREPVQPPWLPEHLKILLRTDGKHIVYDDRRPLGDRTVSVHKTYDEAVKAAPGAPTI
jgi:hypothetical protein